MSNNPNAKLFSILAYFGILWIVGLLAAKDDLFVKYHVNQGLILFILGVAGAIVSVIPILGAIISAIVSVICFFFYFNFFFKRRISPENYSSRRFGRGLW